MTQQDYLLFAASVSRSRMASNIKGSAAIRAAKSDALRLVSIDIAASLASHDPGFDKAAFLQACGFAA